MGVGVKIPVALVLALESLAPDFWGQSKKFEDITLTPAFRDGWGHENSDDTYSGPGVIALTPESLRQSGDL